MLAPRDPDEQNNNNKKPTGPLFSCCFTVYYYKGENTPTAIITLENTVRELIVIIAVGVFLRAQECCRQLFIYISLGNIYIYIYNHSDV